MNFMHAGENHLITNCELRNALETAFEVCLIFQKKVDDIHVTPPSNVSASDSSYCSFALTITIMECWV